MAKRLRMFWPENKDVNQEEEDLILSSRTLDDLQNSVKQTRDKNKLFK